MAEEKEENQNANAEADSSSGGKKKFILLAVLLLVVIGLSVTGTYFAIKLLGPQPVEEVAVEEAAEEAVELPKPAIYYPINPDVIVTFDVKGRRRYLQADVTLMTRDNDVITALETHMPMIRNALTLIIGGQIYEEIQTAEGKELMRLACLEEIRTLMEAEIGKPGVEQVLFTNLVMQ